MESFFLREIGFSNLKLLEDLYDSWETDKKSVDPSWGAIFSHVGDKGIKIGIPGGGVKFDAIVEEYKVFQLIEAYRTHGHLKSILSPIRQKLIKEPSQLALERYGLEDLDQVYPTFGVLPEKTAPLRELIERLEKVYCSSVGVEYKGLVSPEVEKWLQEKVEKFGFHPPASVERKKEILTHLNKSELFETFLHTRYPGQKRFSLEGGETLIPMMATIIQTGVSLKAEEFWIGMSHRGRLNVLSNILGKTYREIFAEFKEGYIPPATEGAGDVKYHKGFASTVNGVRINVASNPSHLESVYPVIEGQVRSRQDQLGTTTKEDQIVPLLIHGDAALAGQGVVYETMQFCRLSGYKTGGTVHIVINNEIGFTTLPEEGRSTTYCTDLAKAFSAPVFHVNAEDPEAAAFCADLAIEMRQKFHIDVFVDLHCYRKYGHNEGDEPFFTQPLEYKKIKQKKSVREIYRDDLIEQGHLEREVAESLEKQFKEDLQEAIDGTEEEWKERKQKQIVSDLSIKTSVSLKTLKELSEKLAIIPEGFNPHRKIAQLYQQRKAMVHTEDKIDWGMGEILAYATLLDEGSHVRLSGQDVARGTFSHRQSVLVDQEIEGYYVPLNNLKIGQGRFDVFNSSLSEVGVLGFEYGYSLESPKALVIWEAQFGDFANGAQVVMDQYISTAEDKWGQRSGLTLLLPHGYEGQGPEHSSARIERFLSLAAKENMQIIYPSTPAQLFHVMRRQVLGNIQKPLIIFTPKVLLRHPLCQSSVADFTEGKFEGLLTTNPEGKRLVLCTGKVYYELIQQDKAKELKIVRIEQLYPLPEKELKALLAKESHVIYLQEEPENMGAWPYLGDELRKWMPKGSSLEYIGRERSASPAVGSHELHKRETKRILEQVFGHDRD